MRLSAVVLLAASVSAARLVTPSPVRHHLRIRGGADNGDNTFPLDEDHQTTLDEDVSGDVAAEDAMPGDAIEASSSGVLTEQQIFDKLNEVPTFGLMSTSKESTGFVALTPKGGGRAIVFFLEPEEAKAVLEMNKNAGDEQETPLRLVCLGLGSALKLCSGSAEAKEAFKNFEGDLRLQGDHRFADQAPKLKRMLKDSGMEAEAESPWTLPVFLVQELSSDGLVPVFLNPREIKTAWKAAGQKEEDAPQKYMMIDIRMLIKDMRSGEKRGIPWDKVRFVGADGAADFANSLQQLAAAST